MLCSYHVTHACGQSGLCTYECNLIAFLNVHTSMTENVSCSAVVHTQTHTHSNLHTQTRIVYQLEMVVLSEDGCASSTDLLHTVPKLERKMTHREAQTFLKNTVKDKWFKEQVCKSPF